MLIASGVCPTQSSLKTEHFRSQGRFKLILPKLRQAAAIPSHSGMVKTFPLAVDQILVLFSMLTISL